jgi:dethiobiotin synthetase
VTGRLVVVSGTGTNIGKTHLSEALLRTLQGTFRRVTGLKPVESGLAEASLSDSERLGRASSFHVQQSGYLFAPALSPHLAAREAGQTIELGAIRLMIERTQAEADLTLVELAGGLFTPLSQSLLNVDVVRALSADFSVLVAPNRLGVLHDVLASTRAAAAMGVSFNAIALMAPENPDASIHTNLSELLHFMNGTAVHSLPRAPVDELVRLPALVVLAREISTAG